MSPRRHRHHARTAIAASSNRASDSLEVVVALGVGGVVEDAEGEAEAAGLPAAALLLLPLLPAGRLPLLPRLLGLGPPAAALPPTLPAAVHRAVAPVGPAVTLHPGQVSEAAVGRLWWVMAVDGR